MSSCSHVWEDAQLRTTKDGMYIASFDYCAKCGEPLPKMKAAPDLLEALMSILSAYGRDGDILPDTLYMAEAAIKKARGE